VASPVHDAHGEVVGAICAVGVAARLKREQMAEIAGRVRAAADGLSADLGAGPAGREVA
jgi:DNA-binding IclR family transcriptional regulator